MRQLNILAAAMIMMMTACSGLESRLTRRAAVLSAHVPDLENLESSRRYLESDFYSVLDTLVNLPEGEAMDHEWCHFFVTYDGTPICRMKSKVLGVVMTDDLHAVATIRVRNDYDEFEEHSLYMQKVGRKWLLSDFDEHKQNCSRHIAIKLQH